MEHLLNTRAGIGVEVKTNSGESIYYFYEDFDGVFTTPARGIDRAMKQLYPMLNNGKIKGLTFIEKTPVVPAT